MKEAHVKYAVDLLHAKKDLVDGEPLKRAHSVTGHGSVATRSPVARVSADAW